MELIYFTNNNQHLIKDISFILFYLFIFYFILILFQQHVPLIKNIVFIYLNVFLLATIVQIHLTLQSGIREYGTSGKNHLCVSALSFLML